MREMLFRGKTENDKWVYGNLYNTSDDKSYIIPKQTLYVTNQDEVEMRSVFDAYVIYLQETIGQYTGLKDKNGVKIFEGDILEDEGTLFTVFYADGGFAIESNPKYFGYGYQDNLNPRESLSDMQMGSYVEEYCEVVGNIHDNKELLGNDR